MPFFPTVFYSPATAADQFSNIFQMMNELDQSQFGEEQARQGKARQEKVSVDKATQPKAVQTTARLDKSRIEKHHTGRTQQQQPIQQHLQRRTPGTDLANDLASIFGVSVGNLAPSSRPFNPRFDVRETGDAYELHGELAGADRENIHLEFTEPQTLVVSGHVERKYSCSNEESEDHPDNFTEIAVPRSPSPARSHRAMVLDEATEEALERGEVVEEKAEHSSKGAEKTKTEKTPAVRYWLQERSVGEFHRVFNFPAPVDEANVRANLDNGILSVTIPKAKRQRRRIAVF